MNKLTLQDLKDMEPDTIFSTGVTTDDENGLNMARSGRELRWVAVRGYIHDWTIYTHLSSFSQDWIRDHGDKVHNPNNIKMLVDCDDEAFEMYRY